MLCKDLKGEAVLCNPQCDKWSGSYMVLFYST